MIALLRKFFGNGAKLPPPVQLEPTKESQISWAIPGSRFYRALNNVDQQNLDQFIKALERYKFQQISNPETFLALYGVGSHTQGTPSSHDVDLLLATNESQRGSVYHLDDHPLFRQLGYELERDFEFKLRGELPSEQNASITQGKVKLILTPKWGLPIDLIYARSLDLPEYNFNSPQGFEELNVRGVPKPIAHLYTKEPKGQQRHF